VEAVSVYSTTLVHAEPSIPIGSLDRLSLQSIGRTRAFRVGWLLFGDIAESQVGENSIQMLSRNLVTQLGHKP